MALQRGREKRLQLAQQKKKEKKTKPVVVTESTPTPDVLSDTETHVERMVEKFLGRKIKEQAKRSRQVQEEEYSSSVEEEESEEELDQENIPPPPPKLRRQRALVVYPQRDLYDFMSKNVVG